MALRKFLLSKTGYKWDAVPVDDVTVVDLDKESFDIFRREALRSGRMTEEDLYMSNEQLLDNLGLMENGKLKRAAVMLFHRNPEEWVTGAFIKMGYFGEGYAALIPIRIHEDALYISNDCIFPVGWTAETLLQRHRSQPYNPNIANCFFRAGYVETWGRGIEKILTIIKKNPKLTQAQIAVSAGSSERSAKRLMKSTAETGKIERIGRRRYGYWKKNTKFNNFQEKYAEQ